jgi:hypothetical protein
MLSELEDGVTRAGYARAARAIGYASEAHAERIAAASAGIAVVLAETLRSTAPLVQDEPGARALRAAARSLLVRRPE